MIAMAPYLAFCLRVSAALLLLKDTQQWEPFRANIRSISGEASVNDTQQWLAFPLSYAGASSFSSYTTPIISSACLHPAQERERTSNRPMLSSSLATLNFKSCTVSIVSLLEQIASVKAPPVLVATPHSSAPSPPRKVGRGVPERLKVWKLGGGEVW